LFGHRPLAEGTVVFIGLYNGIGIALSCFPDQLEQCRRLFLSVDHESPVEYFVPAMFGVYL
jgi:hypothetical protein